MAGRTIVRRVLLASVAVLVAFASPAAAAPGDPDTTFSGDGIVVTNLSNFSDPAYGMALQEDDKVVVVGITGGQGGRWMILRYRTNGTLDPTFSGDGKAFLDWGAGPDEALDVAIQDDGRIVVVGDVGGGAAFAMARFRTNGTLDPTFSGDGKVRRNAGSALELGYGVTLLDDGRIRVAGTAQNAAVVLGYTTAGAKDTAWSGDGVASATIPGGRGLALDVAEDGLGNIAAVGSVTGAGAAADRSFAVRFTPSGALDPTFSGDGQFVFNAVNGYEDASVLIPTSTGLFVAGEANRKISLWRLNLLGSFDTGFSGDGKLIVDLPGGYEWISDMVEGPDGTYLAAGGVGGAGGRGLLAQLNADGTLTSSFGGGDGWAAFNGTSGFDLFGSMGIAADGDIVAAGWANGNAQHLVVRADGPDGV